MSPSCEMPLNIGDLLLLAQPACRRCWPGARAAAIPGSWGLSCGLPHAYHWPMSTDRSRAACRERLERLSGSTLDSESIRRETIAELQRTVGFDRWCWPIADPETLLPGGGLLDHNYGPGVPRSLELEYSGDDYAAKHVLARRINSAASLSAETGRALGRSPRWSEILGPAAPGAGAAPAGTLVGGGAGSRHIAIERIDPSTSRISICSNRWGRASALPSGVTHWA